MEISKLLYYLKLDPLVESQRNELEELFSFANNIKISNKGNKVWFRGLIEISNICAKDCFYCGIRHSNKNVIRYELPLDTVINEAQFALDAGYGSIVIQGGERIDDNFREKITNIILRVKRLTPTPGTFGQGNHNGLGITLSLGEQPISVYREWYNAGAHRYLLRIESSSEDFYRSMHPTDELHSFAHRIKAIENLQRVGFKTGTGVMIGVPHQTLENLANDLLFFKHINIGMVGMGPYLPHTDTPMGQFHQSILGEDNSNFGNIIYSNHQKLWLSLKMIALLRILMPNINIAATTALQVLDPIAREKALLCGANVIMPNITDTNVKSNYNLYQGKPGVQDDANSTKNALTSSLSQLGITIGWNEWGD